MRLVEPTWLLFWLALPVLAALAWWALGRQRRRAEQFARRPSFVRLHAAPSTTRRVLGIALPLLALALIAGALARPQSGTKQGKAERSGAAVAVVLDTSLSMATEDVPPSRFLLARRTINSLAERLAGDRLALVTFAGDAQLLCPMTSDYRAIDLMLDGLYPGTVGAPGSAIFRGIMGGLVALESADPEAGRAILLLTDGEDWSGGLEQAASKVKDAGVELFVLGIGRTEGEPIPIRAPTGEFTSYKSDPSGQVVVSRLEEEPLRRLASEAGGQYWTLSSNLREIQEIQNGIEQLARATFEEQNLYRYSEQYAWLLIPALLLLWMELLWPVAPRRVVRAAAMGMRGASLLALALWLCLSGFDWGPYRATQKGVAAYSREEYDKATEQFESALDQAPEVSGDEQGANEAALLHYNLGASYYKAGRVDDAIAEWDRAASMAADEQLRARAHYNAGTAALSRAAAAQQEGGAAQGADPQADVKQALTRYRRSLELDPRDLSAKHNFEMATKYLQMLQQQQMQQQSGEQGEKQDGEEQQSQGAQQAQAQQGEKNDSDEGQEGQQMAQAQQGEESQQDGEEQSKSAQGEQNEENQPEGLGDRERNDEEEQQMAGAQGDEQSDEQQGSQGMSQGGESGDEQSEASEGAGAQARSAEEVSREEAERILDALAERESELRRRQRTALQQSRGDHDW